MDLQIAFPPRDLFAIFISILKKCHLKSQFCIFDIYNTIPRNQSVKTNISSQNNELEITQRKILSYISDIWIEMKMAAKSDI